MEAAGDAAGEYLESLGKTDLATLTGRVAALIEMVVTALLRRAARLAGQQAAIWHRLVHGPAGSAVIDDRALLHGRLRRAAGRQRLSRPADHAGHARSRGASPAAPGRPTRTGPGTASGRPPTTSSTSGATGPAAASASPAASWSASTSTSWTATWPSGPRSWPGYARRHARLRIGRAPKRLLVYRAAAPFAGRKRHPLEVLARGQQFVAYAVHPDTGRPYDWPEESLAEVPLSRLPAVDEAGCAAFLDAAWRLAARGGAPGLAAGPRPCQRLARPLAARAAPWRRSRRRWSTCRTRTCPGTTGSASAWR